MAEAIGTAEISATSESGVSGDGNGGETDISEYDQVLAVLDVTTANGTNPTLDVTVQGFDPGRGGWHDTSDTFTQATSTTTELIDLSQAHKFARVRLSWSVGGTNPSFDFTIGLIAKVGERGV